MGGGGWMVPGRAWVVSGWGGACEGMDDVVPRRAWMGWCLGELIPEDMGGLVPWKGRHGD